LFKILREVMQKINRASSRKPPIQSPEVMSLLSGALDDVENKKWVPAEALFQTMDAKEPENWYIYNQWGIMLRSKGGAFEAANEKFIKALAFTDFDDEKAHIYTELAVLSQTNRKYSEADEWFRKAERSDSENDRLYIAWAAYHDELGDQFNAQARIAGALGKLKYKEDDPKYKELMLRHAYYDRKIRNKDYKRTFAQFIRETRDTREQRPQGPRPPMERNGGGLPYNISWEDLTANYVGSVVEGEISNITEHGIFVRLSREFTGLIFWRNLMEGYGEKFSKYQKVKVKIAKAFINERNQQGRIDLRLVE
jgi:tetratricopeptide (TPR) repeat protein